LTRILAIRKDPATQEGLIFGSGCEVSSLAQALDDGGVGHPAALTHRPQPVTAAALFESVYERGHDAGTASAEWVADGDRPAVDIGPRQDVFLLPIYVVGPGQHNRRARGPRRRAALAYLLTRIGRSLDRLIHLRGGS
jgi:hypothetical protein